jgi:alkanesulfonate monooxygenase SsuD/methylene tetrahydromethanopterin reductase-like flavin-dependent oxidoreductase (luciferase family)
VSSIIFTLDSRILRPRGALSQGTSGIRISDVVVLLPFPYNHPVRVAERIATLDILSKGRVQVGTDRSGTIQNTPLIDSPVDGER